MAATALSLGFNTTLNCCVELLDRLRTGAHAARKIAIAEVLGEHTGWLALLSGIATVADAVLIPEIPFNLAKVAERLQQNQQGGRQPTLIVVAEGAKPTSEGQRPTEGTAATESTRRALSPGASAKGPLTTGE